MQKNIHFAPALIVIAAVIVGVFVVALYMWPTDSDFAISVPFVHRAKTNANNNANTSNTNSVSNTNSTTNPTAGWKTYTNATYHFSFKYPSDWKVTEDNETAPFHVTTTNKTDTKAGDIVFMARYPFSTSRGDETCTSKTATYGGKSAKEFTCSQKSTGTYPSKKIIFDTLPPDWPNDGIESKTNYERFINITPNTSGSYTTEIKILNTLTFTNPTVGWKTYTNSTYKYSIKYPPEYTKVETPNGDASVRFDKGEPGKAGYQWLFISTITAIPTDTGEPQEVYTWGKAGFPFSDKIVAYHENPRKETLGTTSFVVTDGDGGSSGYPEYFVFHNNLLYWIGTDGAKTQTTNRAVISTFTFTK